MSKRNSVLFAKPETPAFLRKIKEKIGYQEGPTIDTKKENLEKAEDTDYEDKDDEQPIFVTLENEGVSEKEANEFIKSLNKDKKDSEEDKGRIIFKKPGKFSLETNKQSNKRANTSTNSSRSKLIRLSTEGGSNKVKNSSLLSFDEDS